MHRVNILKEVKIEIRISKWISRFCNNFTLSHLARLLEQFNYQEFINAESLRVRPDLHLIPAVGVPFELM